MYNEAQNFELGVGRGRGGKEWPSPTALQLYKTAFHTVQFVAKFYSKYRSTHIEVDKL